MSDYAVNQAKEKLVVLLERLDKYEFGGDHFVDDFYCEVEDVVHILDEYGVEQDDIVEHNYDKESFMKGELIENDYEFVGDEVLCPHYEEVDEELSDYISYLTRCGYQFTGLIPE